MRALAIAAAVGLLVGAGALAPAGRVSTAAAEPSAATRLVHTTTAMGTAVQITVWSDDEEGVARAAQAAFAEIRRLDRMMTTWLPDSEISRINAAAGRRAIKVSDETLAVIVRALEVSRESRGLFDISFGAFAGVWKFDQDMDFTLPTRAQVAKQLRLVNWRDVLVDRRKKTVRLRRKGMKINLGGIAKGYAVDRAAAVLERAGYADFIIQAGGDLFAAGDKDGKPWVVGIRDPRGAREEMFAVAPVRDRSFSTSGDYERGFVKDGVRYHHILDPRTGQPARATRSVTVMAKDAFTADAWSKVLFILGPEEGVPLATRLGLDVVYVGADNRVTMSPGLVDQVDVLRSPTGGL